MLNQLMISADFESLVADFIEACAQNLNAYYIAAMKRGNEM